MNDHIKARLEKFTVDWLTNQPSLSESQDADLKEEMDGARWWLSRCGPEDGQEYPIIVELRILGRWEVVHEYGDWDDWRRVQQEEEPDEDSLVSSDGGETWFQYGKKVLTISPDEDRDERLREYMESQKFWPGAWIISDHGNAHHIEL